MTTMCIKACEGEKNISNSGCLTIDFVIYEIKNKKKTKIVR